MNEHFELYLEKTNFTQYLKELNTKLSSKSILLYGAGTFFEYINENFDLNKFNIIGISDRRFSDDEEGTTFLNYKVIPVSKIENYNPNTIIVTTIKNKKIISSLKENLSNIEVFPLITENEEAYKEYISVEDVKSKLEKCNFILKKYDKNTKEAMFSNGDLSILTDTQYPWIVYEIFSDKIYELQSDIDKNLEYNVLDIGANRCYASLFFAQKSNVKSIYAFELVKHTAEFARKILELNPKYKDKIHLYDFGLGKENTTVTINMLPHRDGCNTFNNDFFESYMPEEIGRGIPQICDVKKASEVLKPIVLDNNLQNIILKIDAEGAEYDIFEDLKDNFPEIFDRVHVIIGDAHLGFERFFNLLPENKFKIIYAHKQADGCCPFELSKI